MSVNYYIASLALSVLHLMTGMIGGAVVVRHVTVLPRVSGILLLVGCSLLMLNGGLAIVMQAIYYGGRVVAGTYLVNSMHLLSMMSHLLSCAVLTAGLYKLCKNEKCLF